MRRSVKDISWPLTENTKMQSKCCISKYKFVHLVGGCGQLLVRNRKIKPEVFLFVCMLLSVYTSFGQSFDICGDGHSAPSLRCLRDLLHLWV